MGENLLGRNKERGVKNEMATEWGREMERRMAGLDRDWRGTRRGI